MTELSAPSMAPSTPVALCTSEPPSTSGPWPSPARRGLPTLSSGGGGRVSATPTSSVAPPSSTVPPPSAALSSSNAPSTSAASSSSSSQPLPVQPPPSVPPSVSPQPSMPATAPPATASAAPSSAPPSAPTASTAPSKPAPPATKTTKIPQTTALATEAKDVLTRAGVSGVGRRCASYAPTLDELKSTTFSDYIRGEVLGVPLPGYEFLYIYEDKGGREQKREVPLGQVPPGEGEKKDKGRGEGRRTRSQRKIDALQKSGMCANVTPPQTFVHAPKKYEMCWHKLRDGIAKVSLPTGFWAKVDTTARGRHWARGSKLGDMTIPSPIKQALSGIGGVYEYTLVEQPSISVADFRVQADEYRKRHVGTEVDEDDSDDLCDNLARKFWRRLGPTMEPSTYGADMEGTLFKDSHAHGWNVDRLESCLCLLRADASEGHRDDKVFHLPGVTSAYLYFGMWASAFAAHTEDMNLLSINYLHAGAPKYWYAIAQEDSKRFESLARSHFIGPASECDEFLRHKRFLLSPAILKKAGIRFTTCVQRPGDAMITFPGSYHFGFNTGFNVAESTNFAIPEWIPLGESAGVCMCHPHSVRIQMRRLKTLLDGYERDMGYRESIGLPKLTYTAWAKHEAKRIRKEMRAAESDGQNGSSSLELPQARGSSMAVEVTKELFSPNKKNRRKRQEVNEWRLAKRARPGLFVPNARVICTVECSDADNPSSSKGYEFFIGTVVKLVDGHVKVHLHGLGKKDDMWFDQDSDLLFLDGGSTNPPSSDDGSNGRARKASKM